MKMQKLSHTDVCDSGERQTMCHLMTCGDAPGRTWTDSAIPTLGGVNCAKHCYYLTVTIEDSMKKTAIRDWKYAGGATVMQYETGSMQVVLLCMQVVLL